MSKIKILDDGYFFCQGCETEKDAQSGYNIVGDKEKVWDTSIYEEGEGWRQDDKWVGDPKDIIYAMQNSWGGVTTECEWFAHDTVFGVVLKLYDGDITIMGYEHKCENS